MSAPERVSAGRGRPLLDVAGLHVELRIDGVLHPVIHDLSLQIGAGEAVGLVGESGSG